MNKYLDNIEKAYAIPIEEMFERSGVNIRKDPKVVSWFEKYNIDEVPLNDSLCYILSKLIDCPILKKE